jgi:hypothetical protein
MIVLVCKPVYRQDVYESNYAERRKLLHNLSHENCRTINGVMC